MPLNIQYASDLHLEFPANRDFLKTNPLKPAADILVLAGDVVPFAVMDKHKDFFSYLADHFHTTYWVPGNHEYYGSDIADYSGVLNFAVRSNIFLVNNTAILHNSVNLIFSTLWSKIRPDRQWQMERGLNDFNAILFKGQKFTADNYNNLHEECLSSIKNKLQESKDAKKIVFTHHCPTFRFYPEEYKNDVLNDAFAVDLDELILTAQMNAWIYGHHHTNTPEFKMKKTSLLTNQLGYVLRNEHEFFQLDKCLEL